MSTITTLLSTDSGSASRGVINTNFSNLNTDKFETSSIDTDTSLAANSDTKVPSQKAIKAYTDAKIVDASTTVKGVFEEATQGETDAGSTTGGTGARLAVNPSTLLVAFTTTALTITSKRITKRVVNTTQSATPAINTDVTDCSHITALAQAITSMTSSLTGTPVAGDELHIDITDDGTSRNITWGASFEASTVTLPTATVISTRLDTHFIWNQVSSKWRLVWKA